MLSVFVQSVAFFIVMLSVIVLIAVILNVDMLNVIVMNVVMLIVVVPKGDLHTKTLTKIKELNQRYKNEIM